MISRLLEYSTETGHLRAVKLAVRVRQPILIRGSGNRER